MKAEQIAITVDHNIRCTITSDPLVNFMRVDGFRRLIEEKLQIKQEGSGLFIAISTDKKHIYKAIDDLDDYTTGNGLTVKLYLIESLEANFDDWKREMLYESYSQAQGDKA